MNLTANQRKMIAAFLEEADRSFRSLPALDRADALAKVRTGVQREIRALGDGPPEDDQVAEILDRALPPLQRLSPPTALRHRRRPPQHQLTYASAYPLGPLNRAAGANRTQGERGKCVR